MVEFGEIAVLSDIEREIRVARYALEVEVRAERQIRFERRVELVDAVLMYEILADCQPVGRAEIRRTRRATTRIAAVQDRAVRVG